MATLNIRKRGNTWEWRFEKASIGGKRQQASKGGYKTKAEAAKEGTKALNEYYNTGTRLSETFGIDLYKDVVLVNHTLTISQQIYKEGGQSSFSFSLFETYTRNYFS